MIPDNNICSLCGGAIVIEYTMTFEECAPKSMRVSVNPPTKLCYGHREMTYHEGYNRIAQGVVSELKKYTGYDYGEPFQTPVDISRLAIAIQRFAEHEKMGGCMHDPQCKDD